MSSKSYHHHQKVSKGNKNQLQVNDLHGNETGVNSVRHECVNETVSTLEAGSGFIEEVDQDRRNRQVDYS